MMGEIWRPLHRKIYQHWIDVILEEASDDLDSWESSFIASIQQYLYMGKDLTEPQAEKLESIYVEKTS